MNQRLNRRYYIFLVALILSIIGVSKTVAQPFDGTNLNQLVNAANKFSKEESLERIFIHTDKGIYVTGDTVWFKAYLSNAMFFTPSDKSGVMYLEVANDSNRVLKKMALPVYNGTSIGQFALSEPDLPQGWYTLRAYTKWMCNFDEHLIFKKRIYVGMPASKSWLIDYKGLVSKPSETENISLMIRVRKLDKSPVGLREMQLKISDQNKTLFKVKTDTDVDGFMNVQFNIGQKAPPKNLNLALEDLRKGEEKRKLVVPLILDDPQEIDLQFMPEGGNLLANIPARLAFKAIDGRGLGTDVIGKVYDSQSHEVAEIRDAHKGMGSFNFIPLKDQSYTAKIRLSNGEFKSYPLPAIGLTGTSLQIYNERHADSCKVIIRSTPDVIQNQLHYYLVGESRGLVCYAAGFTINKSVIEFIIDKKNFPSGIAKFTLATPQKTIVNERLLYVDHNDNLKIEVNSNKRIYKQRDSVALKLKVLDKDGNPVQGTFSVAVVDKGQVQTDSINDESIVSHYLLTADLKGKVETPDYYTDASDDERKWKALDNLLLTQGWVGYNWNEAFKPIKAKKYEAEREFLIKGQVTNTFNKPVKGASVFLMSKKPATFIDTVTDNLGVFTFRGIEPSDTASYFIQTRKKRGGSFNTGIEIDEFKPPLFTSSSALSMPWFVNIDEAGLQRVRTQVHLRDKQTSILHGNVLAEVVVSAKKIVTGSKNLNGPGEADLVISEKELEKQGKKTLGDLLRDNVKGFGIRTTKNGLPIYVIHSNRLHLIIDGVNTASFYPGYGSPFEYFKQFLDYYDAEDIKGIEVMTGGGYQMRYSSAFLHPLENPFEQAFVEVTTRSGAGPFLKKSPGNYLFKPLPFTLAKIFYSPRYSSNSTPDMTDIRSTIFWKPDIMTNKDGEATISFYTSDNTGSYSFILQGTDLEGRFGVKRGEINV
ncbi:MAG: hypothetical protein JWQ25_896, partial [Daejeonella sp.]|nr:hypothetical protein [Daejeonella sp.]